MKKNSLMLLSVWLLMSSDGLAGNISISSFAESQGNELSVTIGNSGDEQANDVIIEVFDQTGTYVSDKPINIPPGTSITQQLSLEGLSENGTFAARMLVNYRDTGGYLFSAPSVFFRRTANGIGLSKVSLKMNGPHKTGKSGEITAINTNSYPIDLKLDLFTANEISLDPASFETQLDAKASKTFHFAATNLSGLPNSRYPIYAIAHHRSEEINYATVGNGAILVRDSRRKYLLASLAFAAGICLVGSIIAQKLIFGKKS